MNPLPMKRRASGVPAELPTGSGQNAICGARWNTPSLITGALPAAQRLNAPK
eukprot:CAMPEP_0194547494 /NCGR_PEP_ID=MMETSP0253-20130528/92251_1 /TAXON_ID=2966 /ORGANISM="Noctiluca scintillans" /LENGTH=51 /DNA_ID=CAMNT_0039394705 /DNA_START=94 /DNA_END=246 /DNA_ORIENTATION=+